MVGADDGAVPVDADRALEPPVGGVQGVGVVAAAGHQAGRGEPGAQRAGRVDADVAALVGVVGVRERPADALGPVAGHGHRDPAAGLEHAGDLGEGGGVVGDVLEHLRGHHPVDARVGHRQRGEVAADHLVAGTRPAPRPASAIAPSQRFVVSTSGTPQSTATTFAPRRQRLERVPALAAAQVEHGHAGPHVEAVVVDGQQGRPFCSRALFSRTSAYQSAVRSAVDRQV